MSSIGKCCANAVLFATRQAKAENFKKAIQSSLKSAVSQNVTENGRGDAFLRPSIREQAFDTKSEHPSILIEIAQSDVRPCVTSGEYLSKANPIVTEAMNMGAREVTVNKNKDGSIGSYGIMF